MIVVVDTRDLEAPEPMRRALATLPSLPLGAAVCLRHRRAPTLLYPILEKKGYAHRTFERGVDLFEIFIWATSDAEAEAMLMRSGFVAPP
jgi:Uncharacterized conserved protein (DUF2249)